MKLIPAIVAAIVIHLALVSAMDLRDLAGPGGTLLVRDLARGETSQGLAAWMGWPVAALLGPVIAARVLVSASVAAAVVGAGLAGRALGGLWSGSVAALLVACWALSAGQGWLISGGTVAWGLCWLGIGLTWDGAERTAPGAVALGAGLVVLGAAAKLTALSAAPLVVLALFVAEENRLRLGLAMVLGSAVALLLAGLTLPTTAPWATEQALQQSAALAVLVGLPTKTPQGVLPMAVGMAVLGAVLSPRRRVAGAAVALVVIGFVAIASARGERLQPRHLLPLSFGLVIPAAALAARVRGLAVVMVVVALLDTLAWGHAWAELRATHLETAAFQAPRPPWPTYEPPAWTVFHESSTPGAIALMTLASEGDGGVVGLPLADRRESHLEAAAAIVGQPSRVLTTARCCQTGEAIEACAVRVQSDLLASGARLILPGNSVAVPEVHRDFAAALMAQQRSRRRSSARWQVVAGRGDGPLPCTGR